KGNEEAIEQAQKQRAFRVDSEAVRERLGLPRKADGVFTFKELSKEIFTKLANEAERLEDAAPEKLTGDDEKVLEMFEQVRVFARDVKIATPHKVFRIENDEVLDLMMLERRPGSYRYSYGELLPRLALLMAEAMRAEA